MRDFVTAPESDRALLQALLSCLSADQNLASDADPLGGGADPLAGGAAAPAHTPADPLSGGSRFGGAERNLFKKPTPPTKRPADFTPTAHGGPKMPRFNAVPTGAKLLEQEGNKKLEQTLSLLCKLPEERPDENLAQSCLTFLQKLKHDKSKTGSDPTLLDYGMFVAMYTHDKCPKSDPAEELMVELKMDNPAESTCEKARKMQANLLLSIMSLGDLCKLLPILFRICWTPNPKANDMREALQLAGSARTLLDMTAPKKYEKQKSPAWQKDLGKLLALSCNAAQAQVAHYQEEAAVEEEPPASNTTQEDEEVDANALEAALNTDT